MSFTKRVSRMFQRPLKDCSDRTPNMEISEPSEASVGKLPRPLSDHHLHQHRRSLSPPVRRFCIDRNHSLKLSFEGRKFVASITAISLSHFLIWYIYYDIVPSVGVEKFWYYQLPRDIMIGWIRLGYELKIAATESTNASLPRQLKEAILELHLEPQEVCRRLIRFGSQQTMMRHELAEVDLNTTSGWPAVAQKLLSDERILNQVRAVPRSPSEHWQSTALDWVDTFMSWIVRPAIEALFFQRGTNGDDCVQHSDQRIAAEKKFGLICSSHRDPPLGTVHVQALEDITSQLSLQGLLIAHTSSPNIYHTNAEGGEATTRLSQEERFSRRQSAPLLGENGQLMPSCQEIFQAIHDDVRTSIAERCNNGVRGETGPSLDFRTPNPTSEAKNYIRNYTNDVQPSARQPNTIASPLLPQQCHRFENQTVDHQLQSDLETPKHSILRRRKENAQLGTNEIASRSVPNLVLHAELDQGPDVERANASNVHAVDSVPARELQLLSLSNRSSTPTWNELSSLDRRVQPGLSHRNRLLPLATWIPQAGIGHPQKRQMTLPSCNSTSPYQPDRQARHSSRFQDFDMRPRMQPNYPRDHEENAVVGASSVNFATFTEEIAPDLVSSLPSSDWDEFDAPYLEDGPTIRPANGNSARAPAAVDNSSTCKREKDLEDTQPIGHEDGLGMIEEERSEENAIETQGTQVNGNGEGRSEENEMNKNEAKSGDKAAQSSKKKQMAKQDGSRKEDGPRRFIF